MAFIDVVSEERFQVKQGCLQDTKPNGIMLGLSKYMLGGMRIKIGIMINCKLNNRVCYSVRFLLCFISLGLR